MFLKELVVDISHDIVANFEEITSFTMFLVLSHSIDWQGEILHYMFNVGSAIASGYIVHKLKNKVWDKENNWVIKLINKINGKKNKNS